MLCFPPLSHGQAGLFNSYETFYAGSLCDAPFISVQQGGTFGFVGPNPTFPGAYIIERYAPYVNVTPLANGADIWLNDNCPCSKKVHYDDRNLILAGGSWTVGTSRLLTSCFREYRVLGCQLR